MLSEAFSSPSSSLTNLYCEDLVSEGSATSLGRTSTDDELSSRSADSLLPSRKLSKQPVSDSSLFVAQKSGGRKSPPKDAVSEARTTGETAKSSTVTSSESRTSRTRKDSEPGLEDGAEVKRKTSKSGDKKRSSMSDIEAQLDVAVVPAKKKVMSPRRSSESNIVVSPRKHPSESSLRESKIAGKVASGGSAERAAGNQSQRRLLADSKRPSDSNLPLSDPPVGRLSSAMTGHISRGSGRPSSATPTGGERAKKKPTKLAPVARPISAQPSQAVLRRMAEQKRLEEEERERQEREKEERERVEREGAAIAARGMKSQGSCTDGEVAAEMVEGRADRGDLEGLSLKDPVMGTPSANGTTPKHKKSLPVRKQNT